MSKEIDEILSNCEESLSKIDNEEKLNNAKIEFLGKNGILTGLLKNVKNVPAEERAQYGKDVNTARERIEFLFKTAEEFYKSRQLELKLKREKIDITAPAKFEARGSFHPLTLIKNEIYDAFIGLGFNIVEGPEIENDYYNFQALNVPKDHPARDLQDTFYINDNILLRTQTSSIQARVMEKQAPPIRILCPGKVYRSDDDASHSPIFNQLEGLVIDKHITLADLKGTLLNFAQTIFDKDTQIRLRPSYFPFTEPSVEVDVRCSICHGKGCKVCKGTGWVELLGAGVVNPKVLEMSGIDPKKYTGYAFGFGIDRIAMIKYGIPNIRMLYENDIRFLKQFR